MRNKKLWDTVQETSQQVVHRALGDCAHSADLTKPHRRNLLQFALGQWQPPPTGMCARDNYEILLWRILFVSVLDVPLEAEAWSLRLLRAG
ncbi:hypothetical protein A2U01_0011365 [Trifolium medium]|uniref:Uncharacterized protein n=1 Tax=Trifolium medium TaxID=97028 RepID=A0A392MU08_9FABA|nr:hypothetical protein [Trifolium medium]